MCYNCTNCIRVYHVSALKQSSIFTPLALTGPVLIDRVMSFPDPRHLTLTFTGAVEQWHNKIVAARGLFLIFHVTTHAHKKQHFHFSRKHEKATPHSRIFSIVTLCVNIRDKSYIIVSESVLCGRKDTIQFDAILLIAKEQTRNVILPSVSITSSEGGREGAIARLQ